MTVKSHLTRSSWTNTSRRPTLPVVQYATWYTCLIGQLQAIHMSDRIITLFWSANYRRYTCLTGSLHFPCWRQSLMIIIHNFLPIENHLDVYKNYSIWIMILKSDWLLNDWCALRQSLTIDMRSLRGPPRRLTSRRLSPRRCVDEEVNAVDFRL